MFFELPSIYQGIGYYQGLSLILWVVSITLMFLSSVIFMMSGIKTKESKGLKMSFVSYSIFFLFFALTRILYISGVFYPENYNFFIVLGYISTLIGITYWLYVIERHVITFTRKILSIIYVGGLFVFLSLFVFFTLTGISTRAIFQMMLYAFGWSGVCLVSTIYLYLIIKTRGLSRKKASGIFIGLLFLFISFQMDSDIIISTFPMIPLEIAPTIMILGIVVFTSSQLYLKSNE